MKKFKFTIQGNDYEVEVLNYEDDIAEIDVNGSVYKVKVHRETKISKTPRLIRTKVEPSSFADVPKTHKPEERKGSGFIKAPLPGTILSIGVKQGDKVKVGDNLLIMEAMKMENNINSDRGGTILKINVNPGDSVLEGDVLVEIGE